MRTMVICLLGALLSAAPAPADEDETIKRALARPILAPEQPLADVQAFCKARVARMPELTTPEAWQAYAKQLREQTLDQVIFRGQARAWRDAPLQVEWLDTIPGGPGYKIQKLRYAALPGLWIPALLYLPDRLEGRVPAVLNVNGHDPQGKAADYKQVRCINLAKRGMLALNVEWLGMGQLRSEGFSHYKANQLDLCGTSAVSVFYLAMQRGLDVLLSHEHADPQRIAMAGLSGGGWQTILLSALDERVTVSNPVAGYSSFVTRAAFLSDLGDTEQTPTDMAALCDYTHLTALRAPRPTLLTFNAKDECCFMADHALQPLLDAAEPVYALLGAPQMLRWYINDDPGTHNFLLDNRQQFYRLLSDSFWSEDAPDAAEIASDAEIKTAEKLNVPLPEGNLDFHTLAMQIREGLPRKRITSSTPRNVVEQRRQELRELVRFTNYDVTGEEVARETKDDMTIVHWRLKVGTDWTVPAVEFFHGKPDQVVIHWGAKGRTELDYHVRADLEANTRALMVDPFYVGESKIAQRGTLFALLVASVGQRPVGIQASQLAGIGHWAQKQYETKAVELRTDGELASVAGLIAKQCDLTAFETTGAINFLESLHEVIERDLSVEDGTAYFCFGLLEQFDLDDIRRMR